jgi:hypothetical protein
MSDALAPCPTSNFAGVQLLRQMRLVILLLVGMQESENVGFGFPILRHYFLCELSFWPSRTRHQRVPCSFMAFADTNPAELVLITSSTSFSSRTMISGNEISRTVTLRLAVALLEPVKNVSS